MPNISSLPGSGGSQNRFRVSWCLLSSVVEFIHPSVTVALLPYMVFSLFHALTFLRTTILPQVIPPPPPPPGTSPGTLQQSSLAKRIQTWVKSISTLIEFVWG